MPILPAGWALDPPSFWIGFASAVLFAWILYASRTRLAAVRDGLREQWLGIRERLASGTERNLRTETAALAERAHLAAPLFHLSQLFVEPVFLASPPTFDPVDPSEPDMFASVPHLPEWTHLAAAFRLPGLSLAELFASGANLLLTGPDGSGKSTALAWLAMRTALGDPAYGGDEPPTPLWIHAFDLPSLPPSDPADGLIAALQLRASAIVAPRLPGHVRRELNRGRPLLLLDGLDEVPTEGLPVFARWLGALLEAYPRLRVIAAGPQAGYGPIEGLGLAVVPLQDWSSELQRGLIENWARSWIHLAASQSAKKATPADVDPAVLSNWLSTLNFGRNPLELTLKVWAGFAGDALGPSIHDALEAHARRYSPDPFVRNTLETIALEATRRAGVLPHRDAVELVKTSLAKTPRGVQTEPADLVYEWMDRGLLVRRNDDRVAFFHPALRAHLTAMRLSAGLSDEFAQNPAVFGSPMVLQSAASNVDLSSVVTGYLADIGDPLQTSVWAAARLLKYAPVSAAWRGEVLRRLVGVLFDGLAPAGTRAQALAALLSANEPSVAQILRPALSSEDPDLRRLAALGLGAMRDAASVSGLAALLYEKDRFVRGAACMALAAIGQPAAIEALATALIQGSDEIRRAAAEALACDSAQGHLILKEALGEDDLLLRRAAIFGLVKVNEPWAIEALKKIELDEPHWVVRSAATEALKLAEAPKVGLPKPPPLPENSPWLIAWAARLGLGVPPGPPAIPVVMRAAKDGSPEERRAAVELLGHHANASVARELYLALRDSEPPVRDAAWAALTRLASRGEKLPLPAQYRL